MGVRAVCPGGVCPVGMGVTFFTRGTISSLRLSSRPPRALPPTASYTRVSRRACAALRTLHGMQSSAHVRRLHEWKVRPPRFWYFLRQKVHIDTAVSMITSPLCGHGIINIMCLLYNSGWGKSIILRPCRLPINNANSLF